MDIKKMAAVSVPIVVDEGDLGDGGMGDELSLRETSREHFRKAAKLEMAPWQFWGDSLSRRKPSRE